MKSKPLFFIFLCLFAVVVVMALKQSSRPDRSGDALEETKRPSDEVPRTAGPLIRRPVVEIEPGTLSAPVRLVVDAAVNYPARIAASRELGGATGGADLEAIYSFLLTKSPDDAGQAGQVLKNSLLDSLCDMEPVPDRLGELLAEIYRDRSQDAVLRDYAVQHVPVFYERVEKMPETIRPDREAELGLARAVLWEATRETDGSIAGTALLALARLSEGRPEISSQRVSGTAMRYVGESGASELTRITAMQVCAQMGNGGSVPVLTRVAESGETMTLRISAVGALGMMGSVEAAPVLTNLVRGAEVRLQKPAQQALNSIWRQEEQRQAANKGRI